jgi:hypothetical protein
MSEYLKEYYKDNMSYLIDQNNGYDRVNDSLKGAFKNFMIFDTFNNLNILGNEVNKSVDYYTMKYNQVRLFGERFSLLSFNESIFSFNIGDFINTIKDLFSNPVGFIDKIMDMKVVDFNNFTFKNPMGVINLNTITDIADKNIKDIENVLTSSIDNIAKQIPSFPIENVFDIKNFIKEDVIISNLMKGNIKSLYDDILQPITTTLKQLNNIAINDNSLLILNAINKSKQPTFLQDLFKQGKAVQYSLLGVTEEQILAELENMTNIGCYGKYKDNKGYFITKPFVYNNQNVNNIYIEQPIDEYSSLILN